MNYTGTGLTAYSIEVKVERFYDKLDAKLMDGFIDMDDYDVESKKINDWADQLYQTLN
jgi:hypothetical protein